MLRKGSSACRILNMTGTNLYKDKGYQDIRIKLIQTSERIDYDKSTETNPWEFSAFISSWTDESPAL